MVGTWERLLGVVGTFLRIGGPSGPGLNANGSALEVKNPTNTSYAIVRGADPVASNDLVTLEYGNAHFGGGSFSNVDGGAASTVFGGSPSINGGGA
jgi:hypothetical protein